MSHTLPPVGHPARELFDIADLVAIATRQRDPIWLPDAKRAARETFATNPSVRRVAFIIMRSDNDELELVTFGRRLAFRREWRFRGGLCPRA